MDSDAFPIKLWDHEIKNYLEKAAVLTENTTGELADVLIDNEQGLKALKEMQDLYLSKN